MRGGEVLEAEVDLTLTHNKIIAEIEKQNMITGHQHSLFPLADSLCVILNHY